MMDEKIYKAVNHARMSLSHSKKSFVVVGESKLLHYTDKRGIEPLLDLIESNPAMLEGAIVGDRIVGRTAALMCIYSKVRVVFAMIISDEAIELLDKHGVLATWQETVPYIVEKNLTSRYKLDLMLKDVEEPEKAVEMIKEYETR